MAVNSKRVDSGIELTIENKLRCDIHTDSICNTISKRVFLLSKLRCVVDINTRAHIAPHTHQQCGMVRVMISGRKSIISVE